ncbi:hypothetical protein [Cryobacterium luteum]|uniref:Uncharacterized protein n=1 Tax=Cryobacterium luteum TaxID=1424661 RepID=A0A1H8DYA5_9MICO|nr:hypothetical protein [Cryobacterium luteum]TFB89757.1 hypothetical protein E3O10_08135 [Cryobacterium luteum]SEN12146.1 hypothetical protein SAMN05216281_10471 [Cryobacterium luteum]
MNLSRRSLVMLSAVVTVAVAAVLTACASQSERVPPTPAATTSESGRGSAISRDDAAGLLNAVPGLTDADIGSHISGLSTEIVMEVSVDDASAITAPGVLDYVLRVGWATALAQEPSQLSLTVWNHGTRLDLQDQANVISGVDSPAFPLLYSVYLDGPEYLGSWPGAVPALPVG